MTRKEYWYKLSLMGMIVILFLADISYLIIFFVKIFSSGSSSDPVDPVKEE